MAELPIHVAGCNPWPGRSASEASTAGSCASSPAATLDTGRKQYISRTVRGGRRQAEKELARLVAQVDDGLITASPGTVGELVERWYAKGELEWSPTTADGYRSLLDRRIIPRWGEVPLRRLKAADLDAWYAELRRSGGPGGRPLAANSVKRIHAVLRTALAQAVKWGWLATNPAAAASPPQPKGRPNHAIPSAEDVARLVEAAHDVNPALAVFLRVAAATGARRGELCGLRWDDRRPGRGLADDPPAASPTPAARVWSRRTPRPTPSAACRSTRPPSPCSPSITRRWPTSSSGAAASSKPDAFVFSHEPDASTPWRPDYVSLAFTRLRETCGLPDVRLHDLRHFNASALLAEGTDLRTVSGRLGHADASTTLDIYAHFVRHADEKAAGTIGTVLDG